MDDGDADPAPDGDPADEDKPEGFGECPTDFTSCGGVLEGVWEIASFCPVGGESSFTPCESPWDAEPSCRGDGNTALCGFDHGGSITFDSTGMATVILTAGFAAEYTLTGECALAAATGRGPAPTDPAAACESLSGDHLECSFDAAADSCFCEGGVDASEGEGEMIENTFVVESDTVFIAPESGEPIGGPYCVDGDQLIIEGPVGWAYWVLTR